MEPNETIKIAVLEEQMKTAVKSIDLLSGKIDNLSEKIDDAFLRTDVFNKFKSDEFAPMQNAYDKLLWWIIGTLLAALGGLILAVINFLTTHK